MPMSKSLPKSMLAGINSLIRPYCRSRFKSVRAFFFVAGEAIAGITVIMICRKLARMIAGCNFLEKLLPQDMYQSIRQPFELAYRYRYIQLFCEP